MAASSSVSPWATTRGSAPSSVRTTSRWRGARTAAAARAAMRARTVSTSSEETRSAADGLEVLDLLVHLEQAVLEVVDPGLAGGAGPPRDPVQAAPGPVDLALVMADLPGRQAEQAGDLGQEADHVVAVDAVAGEAVVGLERDQGVVVVDLDGVGVAHGLQLGRGHRDVTEDLPGRAQRAEHRHERAALAVAEGLGADPEAHVGVVQDLGRRLEEGDRLFVRAPGGLVGDGVWRPGSPAGGDDGLDAPRPGPPPDVGEDQAGRRTRDVAFGLTPGHLRGVSDRGQDCGVCARCWTAPAMESTWPTTVILPESEPRRGAGLSPGPPPRGRRRR